MSVLTPAQRSAITRVLESPQSFAAFASDSSRLGRIENPEQDLRTMRVTPSIRLIFTKTAEGVQVLDLVERSTLNRFTAKGAKKESRERVPTPKTATVGELTKK
jgi:hypothetical protein